LEKDVYVVEVRAMNCRRVQSEMAAWSAGLLSPAEAAAFEQHCAHCAACRGEKEAFDGTMQLLSVLTQPMPSAESSRQMWRVCAADWTMRVEMHRTKRPIWGAFRGWALEQPRWGWAALGGAVAVFLGAWFYGPSGAPTLPEDGGPVRFIRSPQEGIVPETPALRVGFSTPPAPVSSAVNYHAATSFDPFVDHVATGLVSSQTPVEPAAR
jgi:hypothetical protein